MAKLLITMIDWEYPSDGNSPLPIIWDIQQENQLMALYLSLANGVILEMKAECDTEDSLDILRGIILGAGSCVTVTLSDDEKKKLWLYEKGYECYKQGDKSPAYIFVNPIPKPDKFAN
jgi:hypothetical protein